MKGKYTDTLPQQATAVLVALITPQQSSAQTQEYLDELAFLALTLGIKTVGTFTQSLETPNVKTRIGKGKLMEIKTWLQEQPVDQVIFDDELTPSQVRNLEATLQCQVLDRNLLILNIFAMRAQTTQAKIQVELAQYQYLLPRLTRMWTHLSKQQGGAPGMRGPGEKELETDRRIAQKKISLLRKKLALIERQSATQRKNRTQQFRVALVGYTNAGKSTLMQVLSKSAVHAENKLFATISSTVRKVVLQDLPFLLTDTVGFIRKLPHTLIECFKSTLDEVREADLLLHVVDVSHPAHQEHIQVVQETLQEIDAAAISTILVLNKADQLQTTEAVNDPLDTAQPFHLGQFELPTVVVSAKEQSNIDTLKELIVQHIERQQKHTYPGLTHEKCAI